jgi:hypothetical protein
MNFAKFTKAVDNLVDQWNGPVVITDKALSEKLHFIYNDVREQAVKECADWVEQRNKAMALLHSHYVKGGGK